MTNKKTRADEITKKLISGEINSNNNEELKEYLIEFTDY